MIVTEKTGDGEAFELLLTNAVADLKNAVAISPSMGSLDFEDTVFKAMEKTSKNTPFEGYVEKTSQGAFPDIVGKTHYGVEVKQVHKNSSRTRGNSIFEQSRVDDMQHVYLLMFWHAKVKENANIAWKRYEDAIAGVVITHSPRYAVDVQLPEGESLFSKIDTPYDTFRQLPQKKMMSHVRKLYLNDGGDSNLWWLETQEDRKPLRNLEQAPQTKRYPLIGQAFFLCPQVFGNDHRHKFTGVVAYWLSQGYVCQSVRDKFTSSGKQNLMGVEVPQILFRAGVSRRDNIIQAAENLDPEIIRQFWGLDSIDDVPDTRQHRLREWLKRVNNHYKGTLKEFKILESIFSES